MHVNATNQSVANATQVQTSKVTRNEMHVNAINLNVTNATQARMNRATRNEMMTIVRMMTITSITTTTTMTFANNTNNITTIITQRLLIRQHCLSMHLLINCFHPTTCLPAHRPILIATDLNLNHHPNLNRSPTKKRMN